MLAGFSTADVEREERLEYWREAVGRQFVSLNVEPLSAAHFEGALRVRHSADLEIVHVAAEALTAARTQRHVDSSPVDDYLLAVHLRGIAFAQQAGRKVVLRPGDFALFDSARPYRIAFRGPGHFEHLIVRIPRLRLDARCEALDQALAVAIAAGTSTGRVINPLLRELWTAPHAERFVDPTLDLLAQGLAEAAGKPPFRPMPARRALAELKASIAARPGDPELSPERVARAHHMSVRQLHRLFALEKTTFGTFLREARLRQAFRDLNDPTYAKTPVVQIAEHAGFRSAAHFSRAFTSRFGINPSTARGGARSRRHDGHDA